jgi:hypothetical protein
VRLLKSFLPTSGESGQTQLEVCPDFNCDIPGISSCAHLASYVFGGWPKTLT